MAKLNLKERLAKKREDLKKGGGGYAYYVIKEGKLRVRHLPVGEENDWSVEATVFWLGQKLGMLISPITFGKKCAFMKAYEKLSNSKDPNDRDIAKRLKPKKKYFSPVIPYKDIKGKELDMEQGPKLLVLGSQLCGHVVDIYLDEDDGGDFTHPVNGFDLKYNRTGKGMNDTEYSVMKCDKKPLPKELRKQTWDPEEMLKVIIPTYEKTKEMLDEYLNLEPESDDESPKKKTVKKKKRSKDL